MWGFVLFCFVLWKISQVVECILKKKLKALPVEVVTFPNDWLLRQLCLLVPRVPLGGVGMGYP